AYRTEAERRQSIIEGALGALKGVEERRSRDLQRIGDALKEEGILELHPAQVLAALSAHTEHVVRVARLMSKLESRSYWTWIRQLELRFDVRDLLPEEDLGSLRGLAEYDASIVTDGYFYGALRENAMRLVDGIGRALSAGIDCSSLVQHAYEKAGFSRELFRS